MDEYEKLERDLQQQYEIYMERFRNLDYLEHELDNYNKVGTCVSRCGVDAALVSTKYHVIAYDCRRRKRNSKKTTAP